MRDFSCSTATRAITLRDRAARRIPPLTSPSRLRRIANFVGRYVHAAGLVAYVFTIGFASPRRRHLIARLAREVGYPKPPPILLPVVPIGQITSDRTSVTLPHPEALDGNVSLLELLVVARLVREHAPQGIFEIGTFNGRTTVTIAANAPANATTYTLDLPPSQTTRFPVLDVERKYIDKSRSGELVAGSPDAGKVNQLLGDSATFDFSRYEVDLVFVDGSHAYDYVMSDSMRALSMLRGGRGIILWHDYGDWDDVTRALNELFARDPRFRSLRQVQGTALAILER